MIIPVADHNCQRASRAHWRRAAVNHENWEAVLLLPLTIKSAERGDGCASVPKVRQVKVGGV